MSSTRMKPVGSIKNTAIKSTRVGFCRRCGNQDVLDKHGFCTLCLSGRLKVNSKSDFSNLSDQSTFHG